MRVLKTLALLLLVVFIFSCATEAAPGGGPRDVTPPKVLKSTPENYSVNFNLDIITFEFDEFIKLNNIKQKLMVSPPLDKDPEFVQRGKKLIMKLQSPLKENTTYNFFFDDAIVDNNEGNALKNFSFIISTGDILDSLSLEGRLRDAVTLKPVENALIMLHNDNSDSVFFNLKPNYITKTDKNGDFHFTHLKDTSYRIFALNDLNNSYTFDMITENIAFLDTVFRIDSLRLHIDLLFFQEVDTVQKIIEKKATQLNTSQLVFKLPPQEPKIEFYNTLPETQHIIYSEKKDTLTVFTSGIDTVFCVVYDKEQYVDSVRIIVNNQRLQNNASLKISQKFGNQVFYKDELLLEFNNFIKDILNDTLQVVMHTDTIFDTVFMKMHLVEPENIFIKLDLDLNTETKYQFFIPDSAFMDINGHYNKKFNSQISVVDEDAFGNLILKFKRALIVDKTLTDSLIDIDIHTEFIPDSITIEEIIKEDIELIVPDSTIHELIVEDTLLLEYQIDSLQNTVIPKKAIKPITYWPTDSIPDCDVFFVEILDSKQHVVRSEQINFTGQDSIMVYFNVLTPGDYSLRVIYDLNKDKKWTTGDYSSRRQPEKVVYPKNVTVIAKWDVEEEVLIR